MTGSEKQIKWAEQIKAKLAPAIEQRIGQTERFAAKRESDVAAKPLNTDLADDLREARAELAYLRAFLACERADLWIAHSRYDARSLWSARGVGTASKYGLPEDK